MMLQRHTPFYTIPGNTERETLDKINFFKDVVENKGAIKIFYNLKGEPVRREKRIST